VSSWPNRGSLSGDFVQAVGVKQPIYDIDAANGKPGIVFTSADAEVLIAGGAWGVAAADATMVVVAKAVSDPDFASVAMKADLSEYLLIAATNSAPFRWQLATPAGAVEIAEDATVLTVSELRVPAVGDGSGRLNGGTPSDFGSPDFPMGFDMVQIGGIDGFNYGDCTVAFVGVYPTAAPPAGLVSGLISHYSI
jgi:hypothetical protein